MLTRSSCDNGLGGPPIFIVIIVIIVFVVSVVFVAYASIIWPEKKR